ncbi:MAG: ABC transporter ATP-binding protein [Lachnospiraceae bacterium]|nr:ABC transporter ATP-binding protein [Lachnospiraceae bacterium]
MLNALKKIWQFAGEERRNINQSIAVGFLHAVFHMFQISAIYFVILALTEHDKSSRAAWISLGFLVASIVGRTIANYFSQLQQTHAGYFMVANKRIAIGDKLKSVPMGYFNENSLGEMTGITTTVLDDVENTAPMVLVLMLGGFINAIVFTLIILIFDWRIGLIVIAGTILYLLITSSMEKKSAFIAPKRQSSSAKMVSAVLEQVQGMSVIKSFHLTGKGDKKVRDTLEENRKRNLEMEQMFTPYTIAQELVLRIFSVGMILAAIRFYLNGSMILANTLMVIVMSFLVFAQIESAGSGMAMLRLVSASIDHANQIDKIPQMDMSGKAIHPNNHEIVFDKVRFSYEKKEILHDISLKIPDKTTTAIIGPSGSGKTTLCNLIARFWDVDGGSIQIGGVDVKEYTLESLMDQISMVFQNVYLFADTIENNIKFGKPNATHEEVVLAAKKACCHDFIEALPDGYQTIIGEGGASLSGGEKQRISIARAMLKDAPIVIFDEATANIDPENEDRLQKAIEELTRDKTIIMIAHRLKTVCSADQILVINNGNIVQCGKHDTLIHQDGIYADFVLGRKKAIGWKLNTV